MALTTRGANHPPERITIAVPPRAPVAIPGSVRFWSFITRDRREHHAVLEVSTTGEPGTWLPWWSNVAGAADPSSQRSTVGEAFATHEPYPYIRYMPMDDTPAELTCQWEPWPGYEGVPAYALRPDGSEETIAPRHITAFFS